MADDDIRATVNDRHTHPPGTAACSCGYMTDGIYRECKDPDCPSRRDGYGHAHLIRTEVALGHDEAAPPT